ncbi:MAG TPA: DUF4097 family beta strand repeat-containing protein [Candidatus Acidoferrales bacterium]
MLKRQLVLALAVVALAAGCARAEEWDKTFTVTGKPTLRLKADDGSIEVSTWTRQEMRVRVVTSGWTIGSGGIQITDTQSGDVVDVLVRLPRMRWSSGNRWVRTEVTVPAEATLDLYTSDGHIESTAVSGNIRYRTGDGHIRVNGLRGDVSLRTGDGIIEAGALDGVVVAETRDGQVSLTGRFDALNVRASDGRITVEALRGSQMARNWTLRTSDGRIQVRLPADFKATLDARTNDGRINVDFEVSVRGAINRNAVRGDMNGGGTGTLTLRTSNGSIRIERGPR